jgi:hypothetical protein
MINEKFRFYIEGVGYENLFVEEAARRDVPEGKVWVTISATLLKAILKGKEKTLDKAPGTEYN